MHTVGTILRHKDSAVHSVDHAATVLDAARLMNERHIGALVVKRGDKVIGIVSIGDLLEDEGAEQSETILYLYEYMYGDRR